MTSQTTPTRRSRYGTTPERRKAAILEAAVNLAQLEGYLNLTIQKVARVASMSPALISYHFWTRDVLLTAIMEEAVRRRILSIVAEGLAYRHPTAIAAPLSLKQEATAALAEVTA